MKLQALFLLALIFVLPTSCSKKQYNKKRNLTIAFYNVENLFDLKDDPEKKDEEFTPNGNKKWTAKRYQVKLDTLARVLSSINDNELPEIIGLCEVENKMVIEDLINSDKLVKGNYKVIHFDSPDFRGIDCALIYRPDEFLVIRSFPIKINFKDKTSYSTRDILYVKGRTKNREVFHIYVNHWPSRIGGTEKTEHKRIEVASILKNSIDSVLFENPSANIIVLGDMNDEPSDISLAQILMAKEPGSENANFINLMYPVHIAGKGSYNFRGKWNMLDNIIVSKSLLNDKGFQCVDNTGYVFRKNWMEYKNSNGEVSPSRTYGGPNYYGGISDHFPVYFQLQR